MSLSLLRNEDEHGAWYEDSRDYTDLLKMRQHESERSLSVSTGKIQ